YDHKALGITARGAWESVKRHFREIGIDVLRDAFTCVGIGDMSGDVFGNGLLYTDKVQLLAAFDHRHIFIDPDPDPAASFAERKRLFRLPGSSWNDYDRSLLSPGGDVIDRKAKSVTPSKEARVALGLPDDAPDEMTPDQLIARILQAPVDLLWNGGIGTYVKAAVETHGDVGDRTNDLVRINGSAVRAKVVGEGGNLGFTQRGRIEYARAGGRINTDFIDNSAGVDTSDHEVNWKILLGLAIQRGELTLEARNELLQDCAPDVVQHVLYDNDLQAQILAQEEEVSAPRIVERFGHLIGDHPLKRQIIATMASNDVVNSQGITFASRMGAETGASPSDVVRAFRIARDVTGATARWSDVEALDGLIDPSV